MRSTILFLFLAAGTAMWAAEDGAALYKRKCAGCHGQNGEGKPAMKAPALKGTSLSADQIQQFLTKGEAGKKGPHSKGLSLTAAQANGKAPTCTSRWS